MTQSLTRLLALPLLLFILWGCAGVAPVVEALPLDADVGQAIETGVKIIEGLVDFVMGFL